MIEQITRNWKVTVSMSLLVMIISGSFGVGAAWIGIDIKLGRTQAATLESVKTDFVTKEIYSKDQDYITKALKTILKNTAVARADGVNVKIALKRAGIKIDDTVRPEDFMGIE